LDEQYLANVGTFFTVESHTRFLDQTHAGDKVRVELRVLSFDVKKMHVWTEIVREDGVVAATVEYLLLHVDAKSQKSAPMGEAMFATLSRIGSGHGKLGTPAGVGRRVGEKPAN
jgi:carnitine 3-dehydrogenase